MVMREKPINFNAEMVRAILDGRKTQTRRIMDQQPDYLSDPLLDCPYGQMGDRLWVREQWHYRGGDELMHQRDIRAVEYRGVDTVLSCCWRPSICMPRWASRITLEIIDVRAERLNNISEQDAVAEGVEEDNGAWRDYSENPLVAHGKDAAIASFISLWESIYGPGSWDVNPLVWVIGFKVVEVKNENN